MLKRLLAASPLALAATPAAADPVSLVGIAAAAGGALAVAGIANPILSPGPCVKLDGARAEMGRAPAEMPDDLRIFAIGRHVKGERGMEISGSNFVTRFEALKRFGGWVANLYLRGVTVRDVLRIRSVIPHGPKDHAGAFAVHGQCLGKFVSAGAVVWTDEEPIRRGDLCFFGTAGEPWTRGKLYLGMLASRDLTCQLFSCSGPFLCFWQSDPEGMVIVPHRDVSFLLRVSHVHQDGATRALCAEDTRRGWMAPAEPLMRLTSGGLVPSIAPPREFREYQQRLGTA